MLKKERNPRRTEYSPFGDSSISEEQTKIFDDPKTQNEGVFFTTNSPLIVLLFAFATVKSLPQIRIIATTQSLFTLVFILPNCGI